MKDKCQTRMPGSCVCMAAEHSGKQALPPAFSSAMQLCSSTRTPFQTCFAVSWNAFHPSWHSNLRRLKGAVQEGLGLLLNACQCVQWDDMKRWTMGLVTMVTSHICLLSALLCFQKAAQVSSTEESCCAGRHHPPLPSCIHLFLQLSVECVLWGVKNEPWLAGGHPSAAFTVLTRALARQHVQTVDKTGLWTSGTRGGRMLSAAGWLFATWLASRRVDVKPASHWSHTYGLGWVCDTKCC